MNFLSKKSYGSLKEGKHIATINGYEFVEESISLKTAQKTNAYVKLLVTLEDGRATAINLFEKAFGIFSNIMVDNHPDWRGWDGEEILDYMVANQCPVICWYRIEDDYRNWYFYEPKNKVTNEKDLDEDTPFAQPER